MFTIGFYAEITVAQLLDPDPSSRVFSHKITAFGYGGYGFSLPV